MIKKKYLIQLSGGMDSLGAFYALISDNPPKTGDEITFIHIQLRDTLSKLKHQSHADPLSRSCRWLVQLECAYRQYKYIKSQFPDFKINFISPYYYLDNGYYSVGHDVSFLCPTTFYMAGKMNYDYVVRGGHTDEAVKDREEYAGTQIWIKAHTNRDGFCFSDIIKDLVAEIYECKFRELYPTLGYNNTKLLEIIPKELHKTLWICQAPMLEGYTVKPCVDNMCNKCGRYENKVYNTIELEYTKPLLKNYEEYLEIMECLKS